jgi:pimeloyl-ACP methyl ester carboxylesterase
MAEQAEGEAPPADLNAPGKHRVRISGVSTSYTVSGEGRPVLFLHAWGLGHRTYSRPLAALAQRGCRVYAPSLPGFAGSAPLPARRRTLAGYAEWAESFLHALGITEPAIVIGHSFGGGVAVGLAHRRPDAVRHLVLVNSVGAASAPRDGKRPGYIGGRPVWSWALQFGRELLPPGQGMRLVAGSWTDITANLVTNPVGLMEIGWLAAGADLTEELAGLSRSGVPVLALRGHADGVVPLSAFQALCAAVGIEGRIVKGNHSFPLTDPAAFDEEMGNLLLPPARRHRRRPSAAAPDTASTASPGALLPERGGTTA